MNSLYSDRNQPKQPRDIEEIDFKVWQGIIALINGFIADGSFGYGFPQTCPHCGRTSGYDAQNMAFEIEAIIPGIEFPLDYHNMLPNLYDILDLIEYLFRKIGKPKITGQPHVQMVSNDGELYYPIEYYHYDYDVMEGKRQYREKVNFLFERNRVAYQLSEEGLIERSAPETIHGELVTAIFVTGNQELDNFLDTARSKYLNPKFEIRKEALEKLWDAWERLKTIEIPNNKKASIEQLLKVVKQKTDIELDNEAKELTEIGNTFMIRHTEIGKIPIKDSYVVDYLFTRMYAIISLILKATNRIK